MELSLIIPCTKRKRIGNDDPVTFHCLPALPPEALASEWLRMGRNANTSAAHNLYCGAGWTTSLRAYEAARELGEAQLRIISAGYGMVTPEQPLPLYNATFASELDQIARRVDMPGNLPQRHAAWWRAINAARNLPEAPLAATLCGSARIMVAVGSDYFAAIQDDLSQIANRIGHERLWIITAGTTTVAALQPCMLPFSARIEHALPGPRATLSQRIAAWVLSEVIPSVGWDRKQIERHIHQAERLADASQGRPNRKKSTDKEVQSWITARPPTEYQKSVRSLLSEYRASGLACEEDRFRRLYDSAPSQSSLTSEAGASS